MRYNDDDVLVAKDNTVPCVNKPTLSMPVSADIFTPHCTCFGLRKVRSIHYATGLSTKTTFQVTSTVQRPNIHIHGSQIIYELEKSVIKSSAATTGKLAYSRFTRNGRTNTPVSDGNSTLFYTFTVPHHTML